MNTSKPKVTESGDSRALFWSRWAFLVLLTVEFRPAVHAQSADFIPETQKPIRNAVYTLYCDQGLEGCASLKIGAIHKDFQRKGFFRIGVLPMAVCEGVSIEVRNAAALSNTLAQCHHLFAPRSGRRVELRQVQWRTSGATLCSLSCGLAHPAADGAWDLLEGVTLDCGTNRIQAPRARLQLTGPNAGEVVMQTISAQTNSLYAPSEAAALHKSIKEP